MGTLQVSNCIEWLMKGFCVKPTAAFLKEGWRTLVKVHYEQDAYRAGQRHAGMGTGLAAGEGKTSRRASPDQPTT